MRSFQVSGRRSAQTRACKQTPPQLLALADELGDRFEDDLGKGDNSQPSPPVNGKASKVTGNAGARIACGEIKIAS